MTDIKIFKEIAAKNLPKVLFQMLDPHLNSLFDEISKAEEEARKIASEESSNEAHLEMIQFEFHELVSSMWPAFARERWPEVDGYVRNLKYHDWLY